jgi:hypothetical protein
MTSRLPQKTIVLAPVLLLTTMLYWRGLGGVEGLILLCCLPTTLAMLSIAYCRAYETAIRLRRENLHLRGLDQPDPWARSHLT